MSRRPTVVELFAGAGGMAVGLHRAGFTHAALGEMDRHACATLRAAFPGARVVEARLSGEEDLVPAGTPVDLLAGGPPCQPFSSAGHRRGQWDPRDGFPVFLRFIARYQPRMILMENVKGLLSPTHRAYFDAILDALRAEGYTVDWRLLNAADYGVPQRRERVFVVGFRDPAAAARWVWPTQTHSLESLVVDKYLTATGEMCPPETATRYERAAARILSAPAPKAGTKAHARWLAAQRAATLRPWVTVRQALGGLVQEYLPGPTLHTPPVPGHADVELVEEGRGGHYDGEVASRAKSLLYKRTQPDVPADTVSAAAEQKGSEHCARIVLRDRGGWSGSPGGKTREQGIDEPSPAVLSNWAKGAPEVVVRNIGAGDGLGARLDDVAPTVPAKVGGQSGLAAMDARVEHAWTGSEGTTEPGRVHRRPGLILRRLSHAEVAALQTFPADHPWQGPSTAIYRQIGNAVPSLLAAQLGAALRAAMEER